MSKSSCCLHQGLPSRLPRWAPVCLPHIFRGWQVFRSPDQHKSHFTTTSFPFSETCFLFSTCAEVLECEECITEANSCPEEEELCSGPVEGTLGQVGNSMGNLEPTLDGNSVGNLEQTLGQNIVEFLPDVESEASCLEACLANDNCTFYTHHRLLCWGLQQNGLKLQQVFIFVRNWPGKICNTFSKCDISYPGACVLLSHLEGDLLPCEHCRWIWL